MKRRNPRQDEPDLPEEEAMTTLVPLSRFAITNSKEERDKKEGKKERKEEKIGEGAQMSKQPFPPMQFLAAAFSPDTVRQ